jgi:hypothetical protein
VTGSEPFLNVSETTEKVPTYRCPCCRFKTLNGRAGFELCPICWWEDDGQDEHDADRVRGGPNGGLSLRQAKKNFAQHRASDPQFVTRVRRPLPEEL